MGHVIFLSQALSIGMEDKFLPSVQQPNHGFLRFITVCDSGDAGPHPACSTWVSVQVIPALIWTKVCKKMHRFIAGFCSCYKS